MIRWGLWLALWAAGCSAADPCDGLSGTCVSARVEGLPSSLDQLRITVDGQAAPMMSPQTPSGFSLPVRLAIVLSTPATSATITVDGLAGGATVGSSGARVVPLVAGGKTSYTFTLAPAGNPGDMEMLGFFMGAPGPLTGVPY